eukprot:m51a1_g1159 hypothetical protein (309) ;mRNA; r:323040-324356
MELVSPTQDPTEEVSLPEETEKAVVINFVSKWIVYPGDPDEEFALAKESPRYSNLLNCASGVAALTRSGDVVLYSTWTPLTPPIEGNGTIYVGAQHTLEMRSSVPLTWFLNAKYECGPTLVAAEEIKLSFFVPNPHLSVGDFVDVLAYMPRPDAASIFRSENFDEAADDDAPDADALHIAEWDDVISYNQRSVAPGSVNHISDRFVTYSLTAVPGSSGGRGGRLGRPHELAFVHLRGRARRNYNLGMRVTHPAFAYAYITTVLPLLETALVDAHISKYNLRSAVASFMAAHPQLDLRKPNSVDQAHHS